MTRPPPQTVTEDDLHAYCDGRLDAARSAEVARWLEFHPEAAAEVALWREQAALLRTAFAPFHHAADADLPPPPARRGVRGWVAAGLVAAFVLGGGVGYLLGSGAPGSGREGMETHWLAQTAGEVFLTYAREVRHPVEVGAGEREHLQGWLGNRLDYSFSAPDLEALGFSLLGGRLLPVGGAPGAMLMYENPRGDRTTLLLARNRGSEDTAFQFSDAGTVRTFHWIDGPRAYAISAQLDRPALEAITRAVYDHFGYR